MKIHNSITKYNSCNKSILTLGTFDGVHLGHLEILKKLVNQAKAEKLESIVLTFFPHPRMVLQKDSSIKLLNTIEEKACLLEQIGIQNLIVHEFNQEFSRLSAEEFVKGILVDKLNIQKIIIGHDHRFGRNRTATINDLIEYGKEYNFEVEQISAQEIDEIAISSTKIRKALEEGNVALANNYLGREYFITGTIVEGKKIGRTINFPTANIEISEDYKLIPKIGAYIIAAEIDATTVYGMMNIGYNPTIANNLLSIEAHFFNFEKNIYQNKIKIKFLNRIRDEKKFDSIEGLKTQLEIDKEYSLTFLQKNG